MPALDRQVALEDPQRSPDSLRTHPRCVSGPLVVHECDKGSRTEEPFLKSLRRTHEDRESALVDFLHIGDRSVLRIMGGVVEFPRLARPKPLLCRPEHPVVELLAGHRDVDDPGVVGRGGFTADDSEGDWVHRASE